MSTLTKEQVEKLNPEAQEAVASLTLYNARRRTQLLEKTKRYRGQTWIPSLMPAALVLVFFLWEGRTAPRVDRLFLLAMITIVYAAAQFQIKGLNRRLDALIELLESDLRSQKTTADHQ